MDLIAGAEPKFEKINIEWWATWGGVAAFSWFGVLSVYLQLASVSAYMFIYMFALGYTTTKFIANRYNQLVDKNWDNYIKALAKREGEVLQGINDISKEMVAAALETCWQMQDDRITYGKDELYWNFKRYVSSMCAYQHYNRYW